MLRHVLEIHYSEMAALVAFKWYAVKGRVGKYQPF